MKDSENFPDERQQSEEREYSVAEFCERMLSTPGVTSVEFEKTPDKTVTLPSPIQFGADEAPARTIYFPSYTCTVYYIYATEDDPDGTEPKPVTSWGETLQQAAEYAEESIQSFWDVNFLSEKPETFE